MLFKTHSLSSIGGRQLPDNDDDGASDADGDGVWVGEWERATIARIYASTYSAPNEVELG